MRKLISIMFLAIVFVACENNQSKQSKPTSDQKLTVFAVNYPLYYFADRIGGAYIAIDYPIPKFVDPAYWVPKESLEEIQNADLILTNGANYAKWMEKVSLPTSKLVNTSEAFKDDYIKIQMGDTHSHGADGEHVHYGYAFTTWLNLKIAVGQAEAILKAFSAKRPDLKNQFESNFEALKTELLQLDAEMTEVTKRLGDQNIFGSHPVYQYFGQAYNLQIYSEHWEPGEMPTDKQWTEFIHNLEHHPSKIMLWEGEPSQEIVDKLLDKNVWSVVFEPCDNKPENGDFISVMKQNISNLKKYIEEAC